MSKPTFIPALTLVFLLLSAFRPFLPSVSAQPTGLIQIDLSKPANKICIFGDQAFLCQGFDGLTLLNLQAFSEVPEMPQTAYFPQILAMDVVPYQDATYLVCTRDAKLLWVEVHPDPVMPALFTLNVLREAPLEGTPVRLEWRGNLLAVASGGAGICLYELSDAEGELRLVGRYPFAEFGCDLFFLNDTTLAVIDSQLGVAAVLDVTDPRNPRRVQQLNLPHSGFLDQFISTPEKPEQLMLASRSGFLYLCKVEPLPFPTIKPLDQLLIPISRNPLSTAMNLNDAVLVGDSVVLLERYSGLHVVSASETSLTLDEPYIPLNETRSLARWKDQLLISQENGALLFLPLDQLLP